MKLVTEPHVGQHPYIRSKQINVIQIVSGPPDITDCFLPFIAVGDLQLLVLGQYKFGDISQTFANSFLLLLGNLADIVKRPMLCRQVFELELVISSSKCAHLHVCDCGTSGSNDVYCFDLEFQFFKLIILLMMWVQKRLMLQTQIYICYVTHRDPGTSLKPRNFENLLLDEN